MLPAKLLSGYAAARSMTEAEARVEIEATLTAVAATFGGRRFAYHTAEDTTQAAFLLGWQALCHDPDDPSRRVYDPGRPLRPYLCRHIKNRLHNWKRDTFLRPEAPCSCCDTFNPPPDPCRAWLKWNKLNGAKMALSRGGDTADWHNPADDSESVNELAVEIDRWVDAHLPPQQRSDFLRMKQGASLPKARREAVRKLIRGAFADAQA